MSCQARVDKTNKKKLKMDKCWIYVSFSFSALSYAVVIGWQELVPQDFLPDEFLRAIKYSDYSSVRNFLLNIKSLIRDRVNISRTLTLSCHSAFSYALQPVSFGVDISFAHLFKFSHD